MKELEFELSASKAISGRNLEYNNKNNNRYFILKSGSN